MNHIRRNEKDPEAKAEWDDYARQGALLARFFMSVQQAKYNVIAIAHVMEAEMEDGKKRLVPLIGTSNFSRNAGKYFDHIVHCEVTNGSHKFGSSTTYKASIVTGSRSDIAIEKLKEASLKPFFDGSIPPPEEAGSIAAASILASPKPVVKEVDTTALDGAQTTTVSAPLAEVVEMDSSSTVEDTLAELNTAVAETKVIEYPPKSALSSSVPSSSALLALLKARKKS